MRSGRAPGLQLPELFGSLGHRVCSPLPGVASSLLVGPRVPETWSLELGEWLWGLALCPSFPGGMSGVTTTMVSRERGTETLQRVRPRRERFPQNLRGTQGKGRDQSEKPERELVRKGERQRDRETEGHRGRETQT